MTKFSRFGEKFTRPSGTLQLMDDLGDATANKRSNIYMLGGGNPAAIPAAEAIFNTEMQHLANENIEGFNAMLGNYDGPSGNAKFIAALASMLNERYHWNITERNICLTNGSQQSFFNLFNLLAGEMPDGSNKQILLPLAPEYMGYFEQGLRENMFAANKPIIEFIGKQQFKYHIDFDNLVIDENIAAICVSRPTNPTGNVLTDTEMQRLNTLAKQHKIPLIVDNAYGFPFPGAIYVDVNPVWHDNIVLTMSLSKLGLPGARTGIVIANTDIIQAMSSINAITSLAPNSVGACLLTRMISNHQLLTLREQIIRPFYKHKSMLATNLAKQLFADLPVKIHVAEGAFFLWLWCQNLPISSTELYKRLVKRGVYILPSEYFFPLRDESWQHQTECLRLTFTQPDDIIEQGFEIVAEEIRRAYIRPTLS